MKPGKSSWTAQITAIYRAVESRRPPDQRICYDPFARCFLSLPFRLILKSRGLARFALWLGVERRFPGGVDTTLSRIRFHAASRAIIGEKANPFSSVWNRAKRKIFSRISVSVR